MTMKNDGFTLFEIITAISLIGIILAISVPKITSDFGYMDKISEEFLIDVRFIQVEAMKYSIHKYKIAVNSEERKYYLIDGYKNIKKISVKDRYKIKYTGTGALSFNYNGTPIHPGTFTIIDTKTNKAKSVTIVPATGRSIILE
ncbi:MAG TPA: hypothetical protein DCM73_04340 [Clostridiales bacterium]|nr:hypothetical protein [Clostridiales bacterium]